MEHISDLFNCSEYRDFETSSIVETGISREEVEIGGGFNTINAIILLFFVNFVVNNEHKKFRSFNSQRYYDKDLFRKIIIPMLLVFVSPMIFFCLALASAYKFLCYIAIKLKDENYVKFIDSFDVFWSLERDTANSVINVLGSIEADCPDKVLECIKERLTSMSDAKTTRKIFYRRKEKYGFFYWIKPDRIDLSEYVKAIDVPNDCDHVKVEALEQAMRNVSHHALPFDGEGLFQIFITRQKLVHNDEKRFALIFRIHHSVGDGVSLIKFLCNILADTTDNNGMSIEISGSCKKKRLNKTGGDFIAMIKTLHDIFVCLTNRILKMPDNNSLHGPKLMGESIFKWIDDDENLYAMVKAIKDSVGGVHFSDVILTALSTSLNNYFLKAKDPVPEHVTVIIPVRHSKVYSDIELHNNFTVNLLDLPVNGNLQAVGVCNTQLRESVDAMINTWYIKLCSILPNSFLRPLMESRYATMVFSNMPGPKEISICGGSTLKSLVFFTPKNGTTGLGVTAFRYGGVLRIAASVDCALISEPKDLGSILDDMVAEIKRLHTLYVRT